MNTDTPRTNAAVIASDGQWSYVLADCSRELERELAVVTRQGGPILNYGYVVAAGENVVAIEVDMRSKRCEIMAESATDTGTPVIWLDGTNALHLEKGREKEATEVAFPEFEGWRIFSAHVCRYTLRVCFVRDEASNEKSPSVDAKEKPMP